MSDLLSKSACLLVSSKTSARAGLRKLLCNSGISNQLIDVAADFGQSSTLVSSKAPNFIFFDFEGEEWPFVLDLLKLFRSSFPERVGRYFVLIVGQLDEARRAEFEKAGGDLIMIKPYTIDTFTNQFHGLVTNWEKDLALSRNATKSRQKATKAFGGLKQDLVSSVNVVTKEDEEFVHACRDFFSELEGNFNKESLLNVVSKGIRSKKYLELGQFVESWIKSFPLMPESVPDITRVVLYNKKFHLLQEMKIDDKLARVAMAAGFVVASSVYLDNGDRQLATEYAKKGIILAGTKLNILERGFEVLLDSGASDEAVRLYEGLSIKLDSHQDILNRLKTILKI